MLLLISLLLTSWLQACLASPGIVRREGGQGRRSADGKFILRPCGSGLCATAVALDDVNTVQKGKLPEASDLPQVTDTPIETLEEGSEQPFKKLPPRPHAIPPDPLYVPDYQPMPTPITPDIDEYVPEQPPVTLPSTSPASAPTKVASRPSIEEKVAPDAEGGRAPLDVSRDWAPKGPDPKELINAASSANEASSDDSEGAEEASAASITNEAISDNSENSETASDHARARMRERPAKSKSHHHQKRHKAESRSAARETKREEISELKLEPRRGAKHGRLHQAHRNAHLSTLKKERRSNEAEVPAAEAMANKAKTKQKRREEQEKQNRREEEVLEEFKRKAQEVEDLRKIQAQEEQRRKEQQELQEKHFKEEEKIKEEKEEQRRKEQEELQERQRKEEEKRKEEEERQNKEKEQQMRQQDFEEEQKKIVKEREEDSELRWKKEKQKRLAAEDLQKKKEIEMQNEHEIEKELQKKKEIEEEQKREEEEVLQKKKAEEEQALQKQKAEEEAARIQTETVRVEQKTKVEEELQEREQKAWKQTKAQEELRLQKASEERKRKERAEKLREKEAEEEQQKFENAWNYKPNYEPPHHRQSVEDHSRAIFNTPVDAMPLAQMSAEDIEATGKIIAASSRKLLHGAVKSVTQTSPAAQQSTNMAKVTAAKIRPATRADSKPPAEQKMLTAQLDAHTISASKSEGAVESESATTQSAASKAAAAKAAAAKAAAAASKTAAAASKTAAAAAKLAAAPRPGQPKELEPWKAWTAPVQFDPVDRDDHGLANLAPRMLASITVPTDAPLQADGGATRSLVATGALSAEANAGGNTLDTAPAASEDESFKQYKMHYPPRNRPQLEQYLRLARELERLDSMEGISEEGARHAFKNLYANWTHTNYNIRERYLSGMRVRIIGNQVFYSPEPPELRQLAVKQPLVFERMFSVVAAHALSFLTRTLSMYKVPNVDFTVAFGDFCLGTTRLFHDAWGSVARKDADTSEPPVASGAAKSESEDAQDPDGPPDVGITEAFQVPVFQGTNTQSGRKACNVITTSTYDWNWWGSNFTKGNPWRLDAHASPAWSERLGKLMWRGTLMSQDTIRSRALRLGLRHPELFDIKATGLDCKKYMVDLERFTDHNTQSDCQAALGNYTSMEQQQHFKYTLEVDGGGATFRLKNLLLGGFLVFKVDSDTTQFWFDSLQPYVHYVPVSRDNFEQDLVRKLRWAMDHDGDAQKIVANAHKFAAEHLGDTDAHWQQQLAIAMYAAKQNFIPIGADAQMERFCCKDASNVNLMKGVKLSGLSSDCVDIDPACAAQTVPKEMLYSVPASLLDTQPSVATTSSATSELKTYGQVPIDLNKAKNRGYSIGVFSKAPGTNELATGPIDWDKLPVDPVLSLPTQASPSFLQH